MAKSQDDQISIVMSSQPSDSESSSSSAPDPQADEYKEIPSLLEPNGKAASEY